MQRLLSQLFRARPGEWGPVLLLQALLFTVIATLLVVKPTASALFLSEYGAIGLPYIFLATAVIAAAVSYGYSLALKRFSLLRVMVSSLTICLALLLGCAVGLRYPILRPQIAITLYLWTALFGVLAASQFWMMANFVFDVRQAKRLFGLIGAGGIAGGIAGGYLTNLLAQSIGTRNLIYLAAAILLVALCLTAFIWRRYVHRKQTRVKRKRKTTAEYDPPHQLIFDSKHLILLCAIVALGVAAAKLVDYQFSVLAAERYGDQDRLAAFFGFWYSTFNIVGLLIQLILTNRVLQLLGVGGALMFLPVGLGIGALAMLFIPGLGAATFSRSVDGSLKQSLSRASTELLFLPLDDETKKRVKTYIDVFVDSLAGGLGGLLLILLTQVLAFSAPTISYVVLLMSVLWAVCVLLIREEYMQAFRAQLSHLRPEKVRRRPRNEHQDLMAEFLRVLREGKMSTHERQLLYVLERTDSVQDQSFEEPIRQLLAHPSDNIRIRALRSLYLSDKAHMTDDVLPLVLDKNAGVRAAAFDYLFSRHDPLLQAVLERHLDHERVRIAGPALVSVVTETAGNPALRKRFRVGSRLRKRVRALRELPEEQRKKWYPYLLRAAGRDSGPGSKSFLLRCLIEQEDYIVQPAILAAGERQDEDFIAPLLHHIATPKLTQLTVASLVQYGAGFTAVVPELIRSGELSVRELRRLPAVLERIDSRASVALLLALIERHRPKDLPLRMAVIKALNTIRRDFPRRSIPPKTIYRLIITEANGYGRLQQQLNAQEILLSIAGDEQEEDAREELIHLLRNRMDSGFNRLMRLLGLRYPPADIVPVHRGLKSEVVREQLSALEFLDNLLELSLKRLIIPLLDRRQRQVNNAGIPILAVTETMDELRAAEPERLGRLLRRADGRMARAIHRLLELHGETAGERA